LRLIRRILYGTAAAIAVFVLIDNILLPWFVGQRETVSVVSVVGLPFDQANAVMDSLGLEAREGDIRTSETYAAGTVIAQNPPAGTVVKKGRRVYFVVSGGEQLVQVPPMKGKTVRDAKFALERNGLRIGTVTYAESDTFPPNTIIEQGVPATQKVKRGMRVSLVVSQAASSDRVRVPDVIGKPLAEAGRVLAANGLKLGVINYQPAPEFLPNTVLDQYPRAGEFIEHGRSVDLFAVQGGIRRRPPTEN
jgi:beta-lactam-binding protein with PASTA domain